MKTERMAASIRVGIRGFGYREVRNFIDLPISGVSFTRMHDFFSLSGKILRLVGVQLRDVSITKSIFCDFNLNRVDLMHFFFSISASRTPWVVTYSHYLPRWDVKSALGHRLLANPLCKRIIAISEFAHHRERFFLKAYAPQADEIIPKICVMHPAQRPILETYDQKQVGNERLVFTLVGHEFFRKGGAETLDVFEQVVAEGYPVQLVIVSSLASRDYASKAPREKSEAALNAIKRLGRRVSYYPSLPNSEVLKLFAHSHIGLLPTYDDLYGYSVLEAQAAACPVVTTDVNSLTEVNNNEVGWILPVPRNEHKIALRESSEEQRRLSITIREKLYETVRRICNNPQEIRTKGMQALARIKLQHSPESRARILREIYQQALDR